MSIESCGPLPEVDENSEIQRVSSTALGGALPPGKLIIRDERIDDYGVDCSLEALHDGRATNCRAQVQLKGTRHPTTLSDGTYTRQIDASNLNYMLNGAAGLYVLHDQVADRLLYAWATEEEARIQAFAPNWKAQQTVTLHFKKELAAEIDVVWQAIVQRNQLTRRIFGVLARSSQGSGLTVTVSASSMSAIGSDEAAGVLENEGVSLVLEDKASQVIELWEKCDPEGKSRPACRLAFALAKATTGRYGEARLELIRLRESASLTAEQTGLVEWLSVNVEYQMGVISLEDFVGKATELSSDPRNEFAVMAKLESLRFSILDGDESKETIEELEHYVEQVLAGPADEGLKVMAGFVLAQANGVAVVSRFLHEMCILAGRAKTVGTLMADEVETALTPIVVWERELEAIRRKVDALGVEVVRADLVVAASMVRLLCLVAIEAFGTVSSSPTEHPVVRSDLDEAISIYSERGILDGELRARLMICDLDELAGNIDRARTSATSHLAVAQALGIDRLIAAAKDHIDGNTVVLNMRAARASMESGGRAMLASAGEKEIDDMARYVLQVHRLDESRLDVLKDELRSARALFVEQGEWCRHLELLQDKAHLALRETMYRDPLWFCAACSERRDRVSSEETDWSKALADFKSQVCAGCDLKAPAGTT